VCVVGLSLSVGTVKVKEKKEKKFSGKGAVKNYFLSFCCVLRGLGLLIIICYFFHSY